MCAEHRAMRQRACDPACVLQFVHERVRGFVKEVQAGGPSARGLQEKPAGNGAAAKAPGAGSQAAAAFSEEELTRQKACQLLLLLSPEDACILSAERSSPWCPVLESAASQSSGRIAALPTCHNLADAFLAVTAVDDARGGASLMQ